MGITDIPMNNKSFIDRFTQIVNFGIILLISILRDFLFRFLLIKKREYSFYGNILSFSPKT